MNTANHISIQKPRMVYDDNYVWLVSSISLPERDFSLWFKTTKEYKNMLSNNPESFVIAILFHAMKKGLDIKVYGNLSKTFLRNIEEFQMAWNTWKPDTYKKIKIIPDKISNKQYKNDRTNAISAFSGGVDGTFALWKNLKEDFHLNREIKAALFVHGFDIPLYNEDHYWRAYEKSLILTDSADIDLVPISTNIRDLDDDWEDIHGAAIVSTLMLFQKKFGLGIIGSSHPYEDLTFPWGSNAITDPLLSTDNFKIIYEGAGYTRSDKIEHISNWPEATQTLRVCWKGLKGYENCCECEKCIRNILIFRALGKGLPPCFTHDVKDDQIVSLKLSGPEQFFEYEKILNIAKENNVTGSWINAVRKMLKKNKFVDKVRNSKIFKALPHGLKERIRRTRR